MKKRNLLVVGMMVALLLTGCQSNKNNAETEALREQIAQLEQQVATLQEGTQTTAASPENASEDAGNADTAAELQTTTDGNSVQTATADTANNATTTHTMEELTEMVDAFVEKANATSPTGTNATDMETFFSLKQEEHQVDNALDLHEDELESQYRSGTLTRDEYKTLERELERLEDKLDDAEDSLERRFGIDD